MSGLRIPISPLRCLPIIVEVLILSEENYEDDYEEEFYEEDEGEFGDTFLSEENDDYVNMISIPRIKPNVAEMVDGYVDMLRKCKTNDEAKDLLFEFYRQANVLTIIDVEQEYIQNRVENLEMLMQQVKIR